MSGVRGGPVRGRFKSLLVLWMLGFLCAASSSTDARVICPNNAPVYNAQTGRCVPGKVQVSPYAPAPKHVAKPAPSPKKEASTETKKPAEKKKPSFAYCQTGCYAICGNYMKNGECMGSTSQPQKPNLDYKAQEARKKRDEEAAKAQVAQQKEREAKEQQAKADAAAKRQRDEEQAKADAAAKRQRDEEQAKAEAAAKRQRDEQQAKADAAAKRQRDEQQAKAEAAAQRQRDEQQAAAEKQRKDQAQSNADRKRQQDDDRADSQKKERSATQGGDVKQAKADSKTDTKTDTKTDPSGTVSRAKPPAVPAATFEGGASLVHNGSVMRLQTTGDNVALHYDRPRSELSGVGIQAGSVLFKGTRRGDVWSGEATTFSRRCGTRAYPVTGRIIGQGRLELRGRKPSFNSACEILEERDEVLVFELDNGKV